MSAGRGISRLMLAVLLLSLGDNNVRLGPPPTTGLVFGLKSIDKNCTNCRIHKNSMAQHSRIELIRQNILEALGRQTKKPVTHGGYRDVIRPPNKDHVLVDFSIVCFSEIPKNVTEKNVIQFEINIKNDDGNVLVSSADLWIPFKKKRRRKAKKRRTTRKRGRRIKLRVYEMDRTSGDQHLLKSVHTRVKKSRWQKVKLPLAWIRKYADSQKHVILLRIQCKSCGKKVKTVLFNRKRSRAKPELKAMLLKSRLLRKRAPFLAIHTKRPV